MFVWFKVAINGGFGYQKLTADTREFLGYFDDAGNEIFPAEGTTVYVVENEVTGPSGA